jgi:hypothetical protein
MTADQLYAVIQALDVVLARDLPVGTAVPLAATRQLAFETFEPTRQRIEKVREEYVEDGKLPETQLPAFEMRTRRILEEPVDIKLPAVPVHPALMLPGATVAILVEAGVMEVAA